MLLEREEIIRKNIFKKVEMRTSCKLYYMKCKYHWLEQKEEAEEKKKSISKNLKQARAQKCLAWYYIHV